jgi:GNAT superfamily N-acetyltransferase
LPSLARRFVEEWAPWYGPDGAGNAEDDLKACRSQNELPLCLVILGERGEVLGTAALKAESVGSELGAGPWLAAVLVDKDHRGKGVGTALVEAIENEACRLGFEAIYSSTDAAAGIVTRRHWQAFGSSDSLRGPVSVYREQLASEAN